MADKIFGTGLRAVPLKLVQTPVAPLNGVVPRPVYIQGLGTLFAANKAAAQADSVAADVATLRTDFNALLAKLRTAGILSTS